MPRWGLVVEQNLGYGRQGRMWSVGVIDHVEGSRDEALAALRVRAERFEPVHPANPKSRRLYQQADGYLLVVEGVWQPWHCRFTVAEQLYDSAAASERLEEEPSAAEPEPAGPTKAVPRTRDPEPDPGPPPAWDAEVPEVPSWLGRDDLP
ncbi:hypothetical protein ACFRH6_32755 [Streptomyces sp. NPDC056749]|uniref:hypothetical protein n=1 Tax=Streptomyces sp. NPDC056749 TaxID=3345936 RepID=UPI0036A7F652